MKKPWDETTLTVNFWHGPAAVPGDGLRTKTGRQYLILEVRGRRLRCLVLPKDEPIPGTLFDWEWSPRRRRQQ